MSVTEPQNDLFGIDPDIDQARAIAELARSIDPRKWEGTLKELLHATLHVLQRALGAEAAEQLAPEVVMGQADRVGGGLIYFPKAAEMRRAMRDARMAVQHFDQGWSIERLRQESGLTAQGVYAILARQKAIRRRESPDLFGFGEGGKG